MSGLRGVMRAGTWGQEGVGVERGEGPTSQLPEVQRNRTGCVWQLSEEVPRWLKQPLLCLSKAHALWPSLEQAPSGTVVSASVT